MGRRLMISVLLLFSVVAFSMPEASALCRTDCQAIGYGGGTCVSSTVTTGYTDPYCTGGSSPICRYDDYPYPASYCGPDATCVCYNSEPCSACPAGSPGTYLNLCNDGVGCISGDATPPAVTIQSPTSNPTYTTTVSPIHLSGTASDNVDIRSVEWVNTRIDGFVGGSWTATGTTSWSADYINLESGQNTIVVTAEDGSGNTGSDTLVVTYNPPSAPSHPTISLEEGPVSYQISISDPDTLNVSYTYAPKPNVYFLVPFANDDTPVLSGLEQARYNHIAISLASEWDSLTSNRHPMKFYFMEPFQLPDYASSDNDFFRYTTESIDKFVEDYSSYLSYPAIYVFLYPEPYFVNTYANKFGSVQKDVIAEVYMDVFSDANSYSDEVLSNMILHELTHVFASLPDRIPPGDEVLFWLGHPAPFSPTQLCDHFGVCNLYTPADSPTGTEGYYEFYSVMSLVRRFLEKASLGRALELSPVIEMNMGIRSKYDDAPYMYYEGSVSGSTFNLIAAHDYGISSRHIHDYSDKDRKPGLYWNIRFDSQKVELGDTRSFSVPKSGQDGRSLLVFASDIQNPGHFKAFGINSSSDTVIPGNVSQGPYCGDGICGAGETCSTCSDDCPTPQGQVCCSGTLYPGDCCDPSDCSLPETCQDHYCQPPDTTCDGLSALWHLDSDASDSSGSGYGGTLFGPSPASGRFSGAYSFDGEGDYIQVGDPGPGSPLDLPGNFTLSAWAYFSSLTFTDDWENVHSNFPRVIQKGNDLGGSPGSWALAVDTYSPTGFACDDKNVLAFGSYSGSVQSFLCGSTELIPGQWYHLAAVRSGTSLTLYINGSQDASGPVSSLDSNNDPLYIGDDIANPDGAMDGVIDEVSVWSRALSPQEILDLRDRGPQFCGSQSSHRADTSGDGCIDSGEILAFIDLWYLDSTEYSMGEMMEAVGLWYHGTGCPP